MAEYVRRAVRVEAFRFGVEPQPQWFIDRTNAGLSIDGMASFRVRANGRLLKLMHGDYVIRLHDLLWVCEGDKFPDLYQLPLPRDEPQEPTSAAFRAVIDAIVVSSIICAVTGTIGTLFGLGWGLLSGGLSGVALGLFAWRKEEAKNADEGRSPEPE